MIERMIDWVLLLVEFGVLAMAAGPLGAVVGFIFTRRRPRTKGLVPGCAGAPVGLALGASCLLRTVLTSEALDLPIMGSCAVLVAFVVARYQHPENQKPGQASQSDEPGAGSTATPAERERDKAKGKTSSKITTRKTDKEG